MLKINELTPEAREVAFNTLREFNSEFDCEYVTGEFQEVLERVGFPTDVQWSLACCQGDGVAFYGSVDLSVYLAHITKFGEAIPRWHDYLDAEVVRVGSGNYAHYNTMRVDIERYYREDDERFTGEELEAFASELEDNVKQLSRSLERFGYGALEGYTDEQLVEMCKDNDYSFDEDGGII